jgi:hypothetical protein
VCHHLALVERAKENKKRKGRRSDILFLQIHSGDGAHCGAMKITVVSKLWFTDWGTYPIGVSYGVKLTTTFIVPYFVKI